MSAILYFPPVETIRNCLMHASYYDRFIEVESKKGKIFQAISLFFANRKITTEEMESSVDDKLSSWLGQGSEFSDPNVRARIGKTLKYILSTSCAVS